MQLCAHFVALLRYCVVALLRGLKATVVAGYPLRLLDDVAAKKMAGVWPMDSS